MSEGARESRSHDGLVSLLAGVGVGILLGGLVALLLAPQTGAETRARLRDTADDAFGRLRESMEELRARVDEVAASARKALSHAAQPDGVQADVAAATDEAAA